MPKPTIDVAVFIPANAAEGHTPNVSIGLSVQEVLTQAQRYARAIRQVDGQYGEYGVPFLLSPNGQTIRFLDVRDRENTAREPKQAAHHNSRQTADTIDDETYQATS